MAEHSESGDALTVEIDSNVPSMATNSYSFPNCISPSTSALNTRMNRATGGSKGNSLTEKLYGSIVENSGTSHRAIS
jgi:hypothetical protein